MTESKKVILVTKFDRLDIEQQIAEAGVAVIEPPQEDDCELEGVYGDYLFWEAEVDVEDIEEGDEDEDEDKE